MNTFQISFNIVDTLNNSKLINIFENFDNSENTNKRYKYTYLKPCKIVESWHRLYLNQSKKFIVFTIQEEAANILGVWWKFIYLLNGQPQFFLSKNYCNVYGCLRAAVEKE